MDEVTKALTALLVQQIEAAIPRPCERRSKGKLLEPRKRSEKVGSSAPDSALAWRGKLGELVRGWSNSMRRVTEADCTEVKDEDGKKLPVLNERRMRDKFSEAVKETRLAFDSPDFRAEVFKQMEEKRGERALRDFEVQPLSKTGG